MTDEDNVQLSVIENDDPNNNNNTIPTLNTDNISSDNDEDDTTTTDTDSDEEEADAGAGAVNDSNNKFKLHKKQTQKYEQLSSEHDIFANTNTNTNTNNIANNNNHGMNGRPHDNNIDNNTYAGDNDVVELGIDAVDHGDRDSDEHNNKNTVHMEDTSLSVISVGKSTLQKWNNGTLGQRKRATYSTRRDVLCCALFCNMVIILLCIISLTVIYSDDVHSHAKYESLVEEICEVTEHTTSTCSFKSCYLGSCTNTDNSVHTYVAQVLPAYYASKSFGFGYACDKGTRNIFSKTDDTHSNADHDAHHTHVSSSSSLSAGGTDRNFLNYSTLSTDEKLSLFEVSYKDRSCRTPTDYDLSAGNVFECYVDMQQLLCVSESNDEFEKDSDADTYQALLDVNKGKRIEFQFHSYHKRVDASMGIRMAAIIILWFATVSVFWLLWDLVCKPVIQRSRV